MSWNPLTYEPVIQLPGNNVNQPPSQGNQTTWPEFTLPNANQTRSCIPRYEPDVIQLPGNNVNQPPSQGNQTTWPEFTLPNANQTRSCIPRYEPDAPAAQMPGLYECSHVQFHELASQYAALKEESTRMLNKIQENQFRIADKTNTLMMITKDSLNEQIKYYSEENRKLVNEINHLIEECDIFEEIEKRTKNEDQFIVIFKDANRSLAVKIGSFVRRLDDSRKYADLALAHEKQELLNKFLEKMQADFKLSKEFITIQNIHRFYQEFNEYEIQRLEENNLEFCNLYSNHPMSKLELAEAVVSSNTKRDLWVRLFRNLFNSDPYEVVKEYFIHEEEEYNSSV